MTYFLTFPVNRAGLNTQEPSDLSPKHNSLSSLQQVVAEPQNLNYYIIFESSGTKFFSEYRVEPSLYLL